MTTLTQTPAVAVSHRAPLAAFGPNWFAAVMGTGIVANAAMLLPVRVPGLDRFALAVWALAAVLLIGLLGVSLAQLRRHPAVARGHHRDLAMAPAYGAPAMALLTVGSGALLAGRPLVGAEPALVLDATLWSLGTAAGLLCALVIPYVMFTRHRPRLTDVSGSWLMAVVAPVVSATAGAGLIARLAPGPARSALELVCAACLAVGVGLAAPLAGLLLVRLVRHGVGPARGVPSLWIVLGPLGQSVTAAALLSHASGSDRLAHAALLYELPVWGLALVWLGLVGTITLRTARQYLPFSLAWWSFTFPVGTLVTGTSELARHTQSVALQGVAAGLFVLLLSAWATVAVRTASGVMHRTLL